MISHLIRSCGCNKKSGEGKENENPIILAEKRELNSEEKEGGESEGDASTPGAICVRNKSRRIPNNFLLAKNSTTFIHNEATLCLCVKFTSMNGGGSEINIDDPVRPFWDPSHCVGTIKRIDRVFYCFYDPSIN